MFGCVQAIDTQGKQSSNMFVCRARVLFISPVTFSTYFFPLSLQHVSSIYTGSTINSATNLCHIASCNVLVSYYPFLFHFPDFCHEFFQLVRYVVVIHFLESNIQYIYVYPVCKELCRQQRRYVFPEFYYTQGFMEYPYYFSEKKITRMLQYSFCVYISALSISKELVVVSSSGRAKCARSSTVLLNRSRIRFHLFKYR